MMRQLLVPALLGLSAATLQLMPATTVAVEQEAAKRLQPDDIFALEWANDVQISPDGRYVVYVRHGFDVMTDKTTRSLWIVDTQSGAHTPLLDDQHTYGNPSWSPDGSRVAFSSNRAGRNQIHVYHLATKTSSAITEVSESPR